MENKILPLGTVVTLKNGDSSELMIISRASIVEEEGEQVYYDYGSVLIPQGLLQPDAVYFFNKENVEKVIFKGYENQAEERFSENYDEMISHAKISKGSVTETGKTSSF